MLVIHSMWSTYVQMCVLAIVEVLLILNRQVFPIFINMYILIAHAFNVLSATRILQTERPNGGQGVLRSPEDVRALGAHLLAPCERVHLLRVTLH